MLPIFQLDKKTIFVTGASSGIGADVCRQAAESGATIVASGRDEKRLAAMIGSLPPNGEHKSFVVDLTVEKQIEVLFSQLPKLDGLVHCAGVHRFVPTKMVTAKLLAELMRPNLEAPLLLTSGILSRRLLHPGASIVFVSSLAAYCALPANGIYSATKAALISAARVMAVELASQKIRVNCVSPGMVRTPMAESMSSVISKQEMVKHELEYPLGFGEPQDVSYAIVYLLSQASRWVTGQSFVLDGGYSLR